MDRADSFPMKPTAARDRFCELIGKPDAEIPLAEACLVIAAEGRPQVDPERSLEELDRLAQTVERRSGRSDQIQQLNQLLFEQERFTGNRQDYDDPRNSFLDSVLERRTGLPITLAIVFIDVGRRLSLETAGIGFPGHFLAKAMGDREEVIVDAFNGCVMNEAACRTRLREVAGGRIEFDASLLGSTSHTAILTRVLSNLKRVQINASEFSEALACCERLLLLAPNDPLERRDRGLIYRQLECFGPALEDIDFFLAHAPNHPSSNALRAVRTDLARRNRQIH